MMAKKKNEQKGSYMLSFLDRLEQIVPGHGPSEQTLQAVAEAERHLVTLHVAEVIPEVHKVLSEILPEVVIATSSNAIFTSTHEETPIAHKELPPPDAPSTPQESSRPVTPPAAPSFDETISEEIMTAYYGAGQPEPILHYLVRTNSWHGLGPVVRVQGLCVDHCYDPVSGLTPLMLAAELGNVRSIKALCDIEGRSSSLDEARDPEGHTALQRAAVFGQVGAVNCLLDRGSRWPMDMPCDAAVTLRKVARHPEVMAVLLRRCKQTFYESGLGGILEEKKPMLSEGRNVSWRAWLLMHRVYVLPVLFCVMSVAVWAW